MSRPYSLTGLVVEFVPKGGLTPSKTWSVLTKISQAPNSLHAAPTAAVAPTVRSSALLGCSSKRCLIAARWMTTCGRKASMCRLASPLVVRSHLTIGDLARCRPRPRTSQSLLKASKTCRPRRPVAPVMSTRRGSSSVSHACGVGELGCKEQSEARFKEGRAEFPRGDGHGGSFCFAASSRSALHSASASLSCASDCSKAARNSS
mmetsp:Transcript_23867/g.52878  ORF Transcript_23867/g.52878 Transcript_23867/m.52878 type:complete len:205 (-) Transcript_23867:1090-1704(-)